MTETLTKLAECRNCGALFRASNTTGGCSNCGYNKREEHTVNSLKGGTTTRQKPWYQTFEIVARRVEE